MSGNIGGMGIVTTSIFLVSTSMKYGYIESRMVALLRNITMTSLFYLIDAHWLVFVFCHYDLGKLQQGTTGNSHVTKVGKWSIS